MRHNRTLGVASRLISVVALLLVAGALPWLSQRDPAASVLRARYAELEPTAQALASVRAELGLDAGPVAMSVNWWLGVLRGDLGHSWVSGGEIGAGVWHALAVSATLTGFALLVAALVAAALVAPAALRILRDAPQRGSGAAGVALTALPEFLLASALLVVIAVQLRWLPPYGWTGLETAILPALALGIPGGGLLGRLLVDAIGGVAEAPWVRVWRLAGAPAHVVLGGVLRRAAAAVIDQVGLVLIGMLGGAVAVEQVFAIPGLGRYLLGAANAQDLPALQAGVLLMALAATAVGVGSGIARRALLGGPLAPGAIPAPPEPRGDGRVARYAAITALAGLALILVCGLPRDPYALAHDRLALPSASLPFGADASGRDLLARVAHGTVSTLGPALAIVLVATLVGVVLALLGEAARGPAEIANATPPILAGVIIAALLGPSVGGAALAVLWVTWPPLTAHAAALIDEATATPYVRWLPLTGVSRAEIWGRHVLPAVAPALLRHGMLRLPGVALALAALGFLGLGAQPPLPDWGLLLAEGIDYVERAPWSTAAPAAALILTSVCAVAIAGLRALGRWRARGDARSGSQPASSQQVSAAAHQAQRVVLAYESSPQEPAVQQVQAQR
ncbi:peptide/nickel transport system permease protein [Leucobacter exalbidus]|uniref:Peptide/nickel transport system permease protein n=1 Tax=Leucobacter exalbidus TaxID=662960 RepID=A0A940PUL2_9MICO|nr:ABC transporter permease subunit [Leucobacter exalbidus]MBP1327118.1 peptide/nickel transport system permease protein [Leucobacter exalbidus]